MASNNTVELMIPPSLAARVQSAADEAHRPAADILREILERHLPEQREQSGQTLPGRSPAQAAARMMAVRKGNILPDGVTIRELMTHGRE
jgi:hypothetical protein